MKKLITKVKEFFAFINAKLVLAFFAGMLFLFLVGRGHNRHERFNHERFTQAGKVEMNKDCKCEGKNFRFEGRQNFRHNGTEMRGMRNPEMRGRFNPAMRDSNMREHRISYYNGTINRIPIMLNEIEIVAPKLSYISNTNMIGEVEILAQKLS